jgi:hypothetical protein
VLHDNGGGGAGEVKHKGNSKTYKARPDTA